KWGSFLWQPSDVSGRPRGSAMRFFLFLPTAGVLLAFLPAFATPPKLDEPPLTAKEKAHWSFHKPVRSPLPKVHHSERVTNPVDAFILARLEKAGLNLAPAADRPTLIRRVTFDLTGLPPTPEEVGAFVHDKRPDAYARVVERLLASPHYGERWARHWLVVARSARA